MMLCVCVLCRYLQEPALYPFSHGLSYTGFKYRNLGLTLNTNAVDPTEYMAGVEGHNTGLSDSDTSFIAYAPIC